MWREGGRSNVSTFLYPSFDQEISGDITATEDRAFFSVCSVLAVKNGENENSLTDFK